MKILVILMIFVAGCSKQADSRNGNWQCGQTHISIKDGEVLISFDFDTRRIVEYGRLEIDSDVGFALKWDKQNISWSGTSRAVFGGTKIIPNHLEILGSRTLSCTRIEVDPNL